MDPMANRKPSPRSSRIATRSAERAPLRSALPSRPRAALERECRRLQSLNDLRSAAQAADESQPTPEQELLAGISHDLRNPLSVILVSARMLARSLADAPGKRHVDAIGRAAEEMNHLLQDVTDSASIDAGRLVVEREPNEADALADQAIEGARPLAAAKALTLENRIPRGLRPVLGDRARVRQVFANLLGNAMKFTPKGGSVTLAGEEAAGVARFSVTDTGPGISAEQKTALFARQSSARRPISQGTGLSVYVAKGIVEALGGRIWVESTVGHGCTFHFTLPSAGEDATPDGGA